MSRSTIQFRLIAGVFAASLVFAACGGGDDEGGSGSEDTGGDTASACGGEGGTALTLEAADFAFEPEELTAPAGEQVTVEFTNKDDAPHTFTVSDIDCDTGSVDSGQSTTLSFTMPDQETGFVCTIHPDMTGTLTPE